MDNILYQLKEYCQESPLCYTYLGSATISEGGETIQREVLIKQLKDSVVRDEVLLSHIAGFTDVIRCFFSPYFPNVWDFGFIGEHYFLIREYIPGISLHHLLTIISERGQVLSPLLAFHISAEVAEALITLQNYRLQEDEQLSLFHGGLSPNNVILTPNGNVEVTDPGLDVISWRSQELISQLVQQKRLYQPPEYQNGQRPSKRNDTYSLAVLLYTMLMGNPPGHKLWLDDTSPPWPFPSRVHPDLPERVDQLLLRSLVPNPERRMVSLEEFYEELLGIMQSFSVLPKTEELRYQLKVVVKEFPPLKFAPIPSENMHPFSIQSLLPHRPELPPFYRQFTVQSPDTDDFHPRLNLDPFVSLSRATERISPSPLSEIQSRGGGAPAAAVPAGSESTTAPTAGVSADSPGGSLSPRGATSTGGESPAGSSPSTGGDTSSQTSNEPGLSALGPAISGDKPSDGAEPSGSSLSSPESLSPGDVVSAEEDIESIEELEPIEEEEDIESIEELEPIEEDEDTDSAEIFQNTERNSVAVGAMHSESPLEGGAHSGGGADGGEDPLTLSEGDMTITQVEPLEVSTGLDSSAPTDGGVTDPTGGAAAAGGGAGYSEVPAEDRTESIQMSDGEAGRAGAGGDSGGAGGGGNGGDIQFSDYEKFGKFTILERVAFGGMAEVFRAKEEGLAGFQRIVALKRILPAYSEDSRFLEMFADEARNAGSLHHPNIVQIYELGEVDGIYYISMEFIDGIDLARVIKIRRYLGRQIPLHIVLDIVIPVCRALAYAHRATDADGNPLNIIHRDVTPHNILLSKNGDVKLTDFGIAKAAQNISKTGVGELKGKLSYMSPEQFFGKKLDQRSDIFQVGIVLYELLTLKKMFEGSASTIVANLKNRKYPSIRKYRGDLPEKLERIVFKALDYDRDKRFQTAEELESELMKFRSELSPPPLTKELADFTKRVLEEKEELRRLLATKGARPGGGEEASKDSPFDALPSIKIKRPKKKWKFFEKISKKAAIFAIGIFLLLGLVGGGAIYLFSRNVQEDKVSINVFTNPAGAEVLLNGRTIGRTPISDYQLNFEPRRIYKIVIKKKGYKTVEKELKLKSSGEEVDLLFTLEREGKK